MRATTRVLLAAALALPAGTAAAAGAGEATGSIGDLLYPVLNLAILVAALVYFGRKPIAEFFAERRSSIQGELEQAADLYQKAQEQHARWQRHLVDLEGELDGIRTKARERAESERAHILADAQATADRIRRDATSAVDRELLRARERLREEASDLAIELAGNLLREQVTGADRERLLDEFIERIERAPASGANGDGR
jgi:F-type H+-transporting ATPase subunit b